MNEIYAQNINLLKFHLDLKIAHFHVFNREIPY